MIDSERRWKERGRTYREDFNKKTFVQKIRYFIQELYIEVALKSIRREIEVRRIFDAGCGFGRITEILCELFPFARIYGMDISGDQIREARRKMERVRFRITSISKPVGGVPLNNLTTAIELLMHIEPANIAGAVEGLTRGARDYIITVDWWSMDHEEINAAREAGFCWLHNYGKLFSDAGFYRESMKKIPFVRQKIRVWRRRAE